MATQSGDTRITSIPKATLPDLTGVQHSLSQLTNNQVTVVFFSCNHCPYVRWVEQFVGELTREFLEVSWIAICSNDASTYPEDDVKGLLEQCDRANWDFPYLVDSDQSVAREFGAVCTPDFYVFGTHSQLVYRGAFDASRPRSTIPVTGEYLRAAIESAKVSEKFLHGAPALGCSIKWLEA